MIEPDFQGLRVGAQLGNLEYMVDDSLIAAFRDFAGDSANYPNLMADDCKAMLLAKVGPMTVRTQWRRSMFLRPPIPGRRIQVGVWLRDVGESRDGRWVRVSAFSVDDIGTEILRTDAVFAIGEARQPRSGPPVSGKDVCNPSRHSSQAPPGAEMDLGQWSLPDLDRFEKYEALRYGLTGVHFPGTDDRFAELLSAKLEALLTARFGDDFSWGGRLSLAFRGPARPGDAITATATVIASDQDHEARTHTGMLVSLTGADGNSIALGEASVTSPSPLLD